MSDPWDDIEHEDAKLTPEDKEFLEGLQEYEDDQTLLDALEDEEEFWEIDIDLEEFEDESESV